MAVDMLKEHKETCTLCGERVLVRDNVMERHAVPDTKFPCPNSASKWERWRQAT